MKSWEEERLRLCRFPAPPLFSELIDCLIFQNIAFEYHRINFDLFVFVDIKGLMKLRELKLLGTKSV